MTFVCASTNRFCQQRRDAQNDKHLPANRRREALKTDIEGRLLNVNRGIFGIKTAVRNDILHLLSELEAESPLQKPTDVLTVLAGDWRLLFTTLTITGSRRTKLGLREFVTLGDFHQVIDCESYTASNVINFEMLGLKELKGALKIDASFEVISDRRVRVSLSNAVLEPEALQRVFEDTFDQLLNIFNPGGWLDITYLDDTHRIGRDDKGYVFYLERATM